MTRASRCLPQTAARCLTAALPMLAAAALLTPPAAGPAAAAAKQVTCAVTAHISDRDPNGAIIRAAPARNARQVARIKPAGRRGYGRVVHVIAESGDWLRVNNVRVGGKRVFAGNGWIHGSLVEVTIAGAAPLRSAPSPKSRVVGNTGDVEASSRVYACRGGWVRVRHADLKKEGWLSSSGYCGGREHCR